MVEEASQIAVKGRGEKERYIHLNVAFQRIARRDKKASSVINAKKYFIVALICITLTSSDVEHFTI